MILLSCIQQALPLFSKNVQSTTFVNHFLENLLCNISKISDDCGISTYEIIKAFAELCMYYDGQASDYNSLKNLEILFNLLNVNIINLYNNVLRSASTTIFQGLFAQINRSSNRN